MTTIPTRRPDLIQAAREMSPSKFCGALTRPLPRWFNIDIVVTSEEVAEVEEVRQRLRDFLRGLLPFAERVRWAADLGARMDSLDDDLPEGCEVESGFAILNAALLLDEIQDLAQLVGWLLAPDMIMSADYLPKAVDKWGCDVPGLAEAVNVALAENHREPLPS